MNCQLHLLWVRAFLVFVVAAASTPVFAADEPVAIVAFDKETGAHTIAIRTSVAQARKDAIESCEELGGKKPVIIAVIKEKGRIGIAVGRDKKNVCHYAVVSGEENGKIAGEKAREACMKKGVSEPQVTVHRLE